MSRSRRKRPIKSWTVADSEKEDKQLAHRAHRRTVKQALQKDPEAEHLPQWKEVSDPYKWAKDGKQLFDPDAHPDWMRK